MLSCWTLRRARDISRPNGETARGFALRNTVGVGGGRCPRVISAVGLNHPMKFSSDRLEILATVARVI